MIAVVPGYISRSVAGSYDNEGRHPMCITVLFNEKVTQRLLMKSLCAIPLRYCHLLYAVDLLHVDQGCQNGVSVLVVHMRTGLLLHGEEI